VYPVFVPSVTTDTLVRTGFTVGFLGFLGVALILAGLVLLRSRLVTLDPERGR
jgi:hypothetical protein